MKQKNEPLLGMRAVTTADDSECEERKKNATELQSVGKDAPGQLESSAVVELRQDFALKGVTPHVATAKDLVRVSMFWAYWG